MPIIICIIGVSVVASVIAWAIVRGGGSASGCAGSYSQGRGVCDCQQGGCVREVLR